MSGTDIVVEELLSRLVVNSCGILSVNYKLKYVHIAAVIVQESIIRVDIVDAWEEEISRVRVSAQYTRTSELPGQSDTLA